MHLKTSGQVEQLRTLERPPVYLGRVTHVMHLAFEDQPITGRDWTDDRSVLRGRVRMRLRQTSKAVVVARRLIQMDSELVAPERVDSRIPPHAVHRTKAVFKETEGALVRGRP
jgi:hypothetical protein